MMKPPDNSFPPEHPISSATTPEEVIEVLKLVAWRLEVGAKAAVEAGYREEPDPERMREVFVLGQVEILLSTLLPEWPEVRSHLKRLSWQRRQRQGAA